MVNLGVLRTLGKCGLGSTSVDSSLSSHGSHKSTESALAVIDLRGSIGCVRPNGVVLQVDRTSRNGQDDIEQSCSRAVCTAIAQIQAQVACEVVGNASLKVANNANGELCSVLANLHAISLFFAVRAARLLKPILQDGDPVVHAADAARVLTKPSKRRQGSGGDSGARPRSNPQVRFHRAWQTAEIKVQSAGKIAQTAVLIRSCVASDATLSISALAGLNVVLKVGFDDSCSQLNGQDAVASRSSALRGLETERSAIGRALQRHRHSRDAIVLWQVRKIKGSQGAAKVVRRRASGTARKSAVGRG